ncbi:MAG: alkaline shock response membrane anchor protein AmaP [Candidatus Humimicrobiaceae bacterium]
MSIFNKVLVIIVLVCLAFFSLFAIVNEFANFIDWSGISQKVLDPTKDINPFIASLGLLFILIISIFILILEFYPRKSRTANISSSRSGFAMITIDTIEEQIKNTINKINGLEGIKVKIDPKSNGIIINMFAKLSAGQDLPGKMQEITKEASSLASEKLGIKVMKTNLTIVGLGNEENAADMVEGEIKEKLTPLVTVSNKKVPVSRKKSKEEK